MSQLFFVSAMHQPCGHLNEVMRERKVVVYVLLPRAVTENPFSGRKRLKQEWWIPDGVRVLPGMATLQWIPSFCRGLRQGGT